jgi:hypothetical protein
METVGRRFLGALLNGLLILPRNWDTDYDWRKCEAKLNALPQRL